MFGNPFDYQRPLREPAELIDRLQELDELQRAAADRVTVRLVSPRRFGKTSLLYAHLQQLEAAGHRTCLVDLDRVATVPDVADRLIDGLRRLVRDPERYLERRLGRLGISVGTIGLKVQVAPRRPGRSLTSDEARSVIRDLLAVPEELATRSGELVVVAFDEFQDLLTADDRLDGLMRSVIQHQARTTYLFAGSSQSMMREIFDHRERPFYGQASPVSLPPLPEAETYDHIVARLPEHPARERSAAEIVELGAGHPQRTILLAHLLFDRLDEDQSPDLEEPAQAVLDQALRQLDDAYISTWSALKRADRAVLVAIADGQNPTSRIVADDHRTARSTLQSATERLEDAGQHLHRHDGHLVILDPLFAEWLRRR